MIGTQWLNSTEHRAALAQGSPPVPRSCTVTSISPNMPHPPVIGKTKHSGEVIT